MKSESKLEHLCFFRKNYIGGEGIFFKKRYCGILFNKVPAKVAVLHAVAAQVLIRA
jgi:hypothetical protein